MTQTTKYWMTLAFLFLSWGYTADGYQTAAYLFSVFAFLSAVEAHGYHGLYRKGKQILIFGTCSALLTVLTGLCSQMPAIWFVAFSSCASCILFEQSSVKTLKNTVLGMFLAMLSLYFITVMIPYSVYGQKDTLLLISFAFSPIVLTYLHKIFMIDLQKAKGKMTIWSRLY